MSMRIRTILGGRLGLSGSHCLRGNPCWNALRSGDPKRHTLYTHAGTWEQENAEVFSIIHIILL